MNNHSNNLVRDFALVIFSIFIAIILAQTGVLQDLITSFSTELGKIASLVADSQGEETPLQDTIRRFSVKA